MGKEIILKNGDTPPKTLEGVNRVVIYQHTTDPSRMFNGGAYASSVEYSRYDKDRWMPQEWCSADFFYCPYGRGFVNGGCPYCSDWIEDEESYWDSGCRYDLYPEDAEELLVETKQVLGEIRSALQERDFDMEVTLYYEAEEA